MRSVANTPCRARMVLAVGVPATASLDRSQQRLPGGASSGSQRGAKSGETRCGGSWHHQGSQLPHLPALIRNAPAGTGAGHPHDPGTARSSGCEHHHDRYPRSEFRPPRRTQPRGHCLALVNNPKMHLFGRYTFIAGNLFTPPHYLSALEASPKVALSLVTTHASEMLLAIRND